MRKKCMSLYIVIGLTIVALSCRQAVYGQNKARSCKEKLITFWIREGNVRTSGLFNVPYGMRQKVPILKSGILSDIELPAGNWSIYGIMMFLFFLRIMYWTATLTTDILYTVNLSGKGNGNGGL